MPADILTAARPIREDFVDATEYSFGSPSTGRKLFVSYDRNRLNEGEFQKSIYEAIDKITGYFDANLVGKENEALDDAVCATLVFAIPSKPEIEGASQQWLGLVHFAAGDSAKVTLQARCDDQAAAGEYRSFIKTIRKNPSSTKPDPMASVRQTVIGFGREKSVSFPVGALSFELPCDYVLPSVFQFAMPKEQRFLLTLLRDDETSAVLSPGATETIIDEDGNPVHVRKTRQLWHKRPSAGRRQTTDDFVSFSMARGRTALEAPIEVDVSGRHVHLQLTSETAMANIHELANSIERRLNHPI